MITTPITINGIGGMHTVFTETGENGSIQRQLFTPTTPQRDPHSLLARTLPARHMTPRAFCVAIRDRLARLPADEGWARGARGLCEMYADADEARFEVILRQIAGGASNSALAEGARWLLLQWCRDRDIG